MKFNNAEVSETGIVSDVAIISSIMPEDICGVCCSEEPPGKKQRKGGKKAKAEIRWICCDSCLKWFHTQCVRIGPTLLENIGSYQYHCEKCAIVGSLIPKPYNPNETELKEVQKRIEDLAAQIRKLECEISEYQKHTKKQFDRVQNKVHTVSQLKETASSNGSRFEQIGEKLEAIEAGAKLAKICSQGVNSCRIAINKVPLQTGENVRSIVHNLLRFLNVPDLMSHVSTCFRLPVKPSKWTDRTITPTILVAFDNIEVKSVVLRRYYEKHKEAKLCNLTVDLPLEYRFTVNEMLSLESFRTRNFALRMKQRKLVQSVYVKNDSVSVRLPGHTKYILIEDTGHLVGLLGFDTHTSHNESSKFFDAESDGFPTQN